MKTNMFYVYQPVAVIIFSFNKVLLKCVVVVLSNKSYGRPIQSFTIFKNNFRVTQLLALTIYALWYQTISKFKIRGNSSFELFKVGQMVTKLC